MVSEDSRMQGYVDVWALAVDDAVVLLRSLSAEEWTLPTDLPGWDVRAVAAHLAHLESVLAGNPEDEVVVPEAAHITSPMSAYTELGPLARRSWTTEEIIAEFEGSALKRLTAL